MKRLFLSFSLVALLSACPKDVPTEAPVSAAAPVATTPSASLPTDATSRKFATRLTNLDIRSWSPEDTGSVGFVYDTFKFNADGTFVGKATVTYYEEVVPCEESGTWTMDPAEDATTAPINWLIAATSCPGRESGSEKRVKMYIREDGTIDIKLH